MKQKLFIMVMIFSLLAACSGPASESPDTPAAAISPTTALQKIRLPMGYIPNVQYAPFYVAAQKGYFAEAGLELDFDYSAETDGMALVGAGELPFTIASGEQILLARAQGLPVVYVMTWWQKYPVGVSAKKSVGLVSPQDLAGKRIGLPGLYGASYIGLRALLQAGDLTEDDVTLDSIGFNQVEALAVDQADVVVIYANNEPVQFAARGYEVDTMRVADYMALASNGLVTNEDTMQNHPELITKMINAILRGIADTLANPDEAFELCKIYVEGLAANAEIQRQVLQATLEFWETEHPGYSQPEAWENMYQVLLEMKLIDDSVDVNQAYTNQFIER